MAKHWPHSPLTVHGGKGAIRELLDHPMLAGINQLVRHWPVQVLVSMPDHNDQYSSVRMPSFEAKKLYDNGMPLTFDSPENYFEGLGQWLDAVRRDLGLSARTDARCAIYCTPDGKGTDAHFDPNANFVIQLHGTKRWKLAMNEHVEAPRHRHVIGTPADPGLLAYCRRTPLPSAMPKRCIEVELKPGSVLFVPRGVWHSTSAEGDALSLNFLFSQESWLDVFVAAVTARLSQHPEWRELAVGVDSADGPVSRNARSRFGALLAGVSSQLGLSDPAGLLASTETGESKFCLKDGVRISVRGSLVTARRPGLRAEPLTVDRTTRRFFQWIARTAGPFSATDVHGACRSELRAQEVGDFLDQLVGLGLLSKE